MAASFRKLVVRTYAPRFRASLAAFAVLAGILILYGAFESGRYDAGYRVVDSARSALQAHARIRNLETQNSQLRTQLAAAEVARRVDRVAYAQVTRSLGDMQGQIAHMSQDLAFYRGLVQPDSIVRVKVQQMQIVPGAGPGQFHLKFVLMQAGKSSGTVAGHALVTIDGLQQGKPRSLSFAQVSPGGHPSLSYSFRYFQDYDEPLQLPAGFQPARVGVELRIGRDTGHGYRQAFLWKAQGMSVETETPNAAQSKRFLDVPAQGK